MPLEDRIACLRRVSASAEVRGQSGLPLRLAISSSAISVGSYDDRAAQADLLVGEAGGDQYEVAAPGGVGEGRT